MGDGRRLASVGGLRWWNIPEAISCPPHGGSTCHCPEPTLEESDVTLGDACKKRSLASCLIGLLICPEEPTQPPLTGTHTTWEFRGGQRSSGNLANPSHFAASFPSTPSAGEGEHHRSIGVSCEQGVEVMCSATRGAERWCGPWEVVAASLLAQREEEGVSRGRTTPSSLQVLDLLGFRIE